MAGGVVVDVGVGVSEGVLEGAGCDPLGFDSQSMSGVHCSTSSRAM